MKKWTLIVLMSLSGLVNFGQAPILSPQAKVSLLTCGTGDDLYSFFGHSAIRFRDTYVDLVFNFGQFSFGDDFYWNFTKGDLLYSLGVSNSAGFYFEYQYTDRAVYEQELNLNPEDKQRLLNELVSTYNDEDRRNYHYDFFYNNCATKVRDAFSKVLGDKIKMPDNADADKFSFREIISGYLNPQPWSRFGIDIVLGSPIDIKASHNDLMFLPDYIMENYSNAVIVENGIEKPLVKGEKKVWREVKGERLKPGLFSPNMIFWSLFGLITALGFIPFLKKFFLLDGLLMLVFGLLGLFILFMWFGTNHHTTAFNYNLLWANPLHLFMLGLLVWKKKRLQNPKLFLYAGIYFGLIILLFFTIIPQGINPAFLPIMLIFGLRYFMIYRQTVNG